MVVVVLLAIVASMVVSHWQPNQIESLKAAARVVAADMAYVRGLAVSKGTSYEIAWDTSGGSYEVWRVAADASLQPVPPPATVTASASKSSFVEELGRLPSGACDLVAVVTTSPPQQSLDRFRFTSTGSLDPPQSIRIWIATGTGRDRRYIPIDLAPQTGLATIGEIESAAPLLPAGGASLIGGGMAP